MHDLSQGIMITINEYDYSVLEMGKSSNQSDHLSLLIPLYLIEVSKFIRVGAALSYYNPCVLYREVPYVSHYTAVVDHCQHICDPNHYPTDSTCKRCVWC